MTTRDELMRLLDAWNRLPAWRRKYYLIRIVGVAYAWRLRYWLRGVMS